jgi:hypothetical protein
MTALVYTCSLLLAALMGFAVHRASLCTVKTADYHCFSVLVAVRMLGNFSSVAVTR